MQRIVLPLWNDHTGPIFLVRLHMLIASAESKHSQSMNNVRNLSKCSRLNGNEEKWMNCVLLLWLSCVVVYLQWEIKTVFSLCVQYFKSRHKFPNLIDHLNLFGRYKILLSSSFWHIWTTNGESCQSNLSSVYATLLRQICKFILRYAFFYAKFRFTY